ncbi:MAG TPA: hypothetical protein VJZ27_05680, partial [Aggregatilineales bacterium]|nr:hypothetical protein [Aggregatilineales bacterium]
RDGTGIVIENEPYEFWEQNGYHEDKQFNVIRAYRLFENDPRTWENQGFYYLVADQSYEWRGGYYAGHEFKASWDAEVEEVARFEGDVYSGPDRIIFRAFRPQVITNISLGDAVIFYGYDVESQTLHPGDTLRVKYYWQAAKTVDTDYAVFNHLLDLESSEAVIQFDRLAGQNGIHSTSQWEPFEWVFDTFDLTIPEDTAPGQYSFQIGLYNPVDGARLSVENGQNGILELFQVTIEDSK